MTDLEILNDFVSKYKTKGEAAKELGMTIGQLSNYLHGVRNIGASVRERLRAKGYYLDSNTAPAPLPDEIVKKFEYERDEFIRFIRETYEARLEDKEKIISLLEQQVADKSQSDSGVTNSPSPERSINR
ncbi:MAG: hypothetical protein JNL32_00040 [Candidatus Kapabacteria bacterium]|nr:hypothetical protein [Candidatus Kapabacteria bacterium]